MSSGRSAVSRAAVDGSLRRKDTTSSSGSIDHIQQVKVKRTQSRTCKDLLLEPSNFEKVVILSISNCLWREVGIWAVGKTYLPVSKSLAV